MEKMEDLQLAMIVARLYEADFENSSTCQGLLNEKVLGCNRDGSGYHCSRLHPDPFLRSIAYWIMKDYTRALDTLLERIPKEDDENPGELVGDIFVYITKEKSTKTCLLCSAICAVCGVFKDFKFFLSLFFVHLC